MDSSGASSGGRSTSNGTHVPSLNGVFGSQLPERSPSRSSTRGSISHRQSFADNLRNPPPSPRSHRLSSYTQQAVQGLVNHPPPQRQPNPRFAGRDWHDIALSELVSDDDLKWAEMDTSVEDCTKILLRHGSSGAVLLRNSPTDKMAVASFDHSDLNAYLLVVIGMSKPEPEDVAVFRSITQRAQENVSIPIRDIQQICRKEPMATLPLTQHLPRTIEMFGSGVHRILVTNQASTEIIGVLSQLRLLEFFWNEGVNFPVIDRLYPATLRDLRIGSQEIIAINADRPLSDALILMNNEGLTSIAVVDNGYNVVGNISTTDVEHLTSVTSFPLLQSSCMHFISVILSERGMDDGRDSFPVFHVNPHSTLAHTVAKLVATRSHRMWVVESPSPSPSAPQTPMLVPAHTGSSVSSTGPSALPLATTSSATSSTEALSSSGTGNRRESTILIPPPSSSSPGPQSPIPIPATTREHSFSAVPAAALPGAHLSGRLSGVVSLSDILNLFAKTTGLRPSDPAELRAHRRRSSSSSLRPSFDGSRSSFDLRR